ncbi:HD-GYP domain-containing protein [Exiguobacterium flavidum]|uniref:HD-GYP domain-containing protein n=1 Tax=Exiguobacterium flavidum TaxID=2184695 RepID=UPI000DF7A943|nr:HD domain-containing phosphohydrolase [Exiguobacterium flavidum]
MPVFQLVERQLINNYILGSLFAVFGVGSLFIFETLDLSLRETLVLLAIMGVSGMLMLTLEYSVYRRHIRPVARACASEAPDFRMIEAAYRTVHRFPFLTIKRILGPHLFGLSVPASLLSFFAIRAGLLDLPYRLIGFACFGAVLIAILHALIEFFLTYRVTGPLLAHLNDQAVVLHGRQPALNEDDMISLRQKMLISTLIIGVFPIFLFSLASGIQLSENEGIRSYWSWAALILVVILGVATFCSLLLYENIKKPISALQTSVENIEAGRIELMDNPYSDEFFHLVKGFNHMVDSIKGRDAENAQLLDALFTLFAATLDARDPYTAGHSQRVAEYTVRIARAAGIASGELDLIRKSALLHDIGKIGIRDDVLLKEGRLTDVEFDRIKEHPVIGVHILEQIELPETLQGIIPGVKYHHERYDGKGYPEGLAGESIPLFGRIMAIADAYDAMTSDRPYRKGMPAEKALSILEAGKGTQWDPYYLQIFLELMKPKEEPKWNLKSSNGKVSTPSG